MPKILTKDEIRELLVRVANDDAFRAELTANPIATLSQYDLLVEQQDVPTNGVELPAPENIMDRLDELTNEFESYGCHKWLIHLVWKPGHI